MPIKKYHLNVPLDKELALEFDQICPGYGQKSLVVRNLIKGFIKKIKEAPITEEKK